MWHMWQGKTRWLAAAALGIALVAAGCDDDEDIVSPDLDRVFVQVERLGNPLVSEVTFPKRDHGFHNTTDPSTDVGNAFKEKVEAFVSGVAGRKGTVAATISAVLIPDMLIVQTDKPGSGAGWLSWVGGGYGGRKLSDDVVDIGLKAIFGDLLVAFGVQGANENVSPGLTSDNVSANDKSFGTSFPYLAAPTQ
ncbi:MAG: DUF4331 family protein [Gemmatimonadetes bacterium]|nr:DUF4331 family protein [Gemmatimonadota bacterium]